MKINFVSFGGGTPGFRNRVNNISDQAKNSGLFDRIFSYTDQDLKDDKEYWSKHGNFIMKHKKGYGFYIWKSYIVNKALNEIHDGDILVYADSGCSLTFTDKSITTFNSYIDLLNKSPYGLLLFQTCHIERIWTKKAIFKYFNCLDNEAITHTNQLMGGIIYIKKNKHSAAIIKEWLETSSLHYLIQSDPKNEIIEESYFKDNRHDQSLLSVISKLKKCEVSTDYTTNLTKNRAPISIARIRGINPYKELLSV